MGTSRIKIIDLSTGDAQIKTSRKRADHGILPDDLKKIAKKTKKAAKGQLPSQASEPRSEEREGVKPVLESEVPQGEILVSDTQTEETKKTKVATKTKPTHKNRSRRYVQAVNSFEKSRIYPLKEAVELVKKTATTKFDSTIEAHLVLNVQTQGNLTLPNSFGKKRTILIFASNVPEEDGVIAGDDKTIEKIREGKLVPGKDFQAVFAHVSYMPKLAQIAKTLGPKGLMPNPKNQTIIDDPKKALKAAATGSTSFKSETQAPVVHMAIGKSSQTEKQLEENIQTLLSTIGNQKIEKLYLSSSMGPSIKVDPGIHS